METRWASAEDIPSLIQLDRGIDQWCHETYSRALRKRNTVCLVAFDEDKILGFVVFETRTHSFVVTKLVVAHTCRRQGIATKLIKSIKNRPGGQTRICVYLRESDLMAQLFLRSQGFLAVKINRSEYTDTYEDQYIMRFQIGATSQRQVRKSLQPHT